MALLEVYGFKKNFGATQVLKGIDFSLEKGKTLAIIGSSGSGKTTLLRCLNFLETPDCGKMIVNGKTLIDCPSKTKETESSIRAKRLHFGLVFQNFNLFPQYTVLENVCLAPKLHAKSTPDYKSNRKSINAEIEEKAIRILTDVGLAEKINNYPGQLSGGQQQRVAIARALILEPDILCFDEPTSALDPELTSEVLKVLKELAERKTTMVVVTHEMSFAHDIADEIIFLDKGVIAAKGTPDYIFGNSDNERLNAFISNYKS